MTSTYALVECIHESHTEHPLIITLHYFIKSWNLLQSNNKNAKCTKKCKVNRIGSCKERRGLQKSTYRSQY
ncbi:hypothetical protein CWN24_05490 [Klebsiella pneumoniae]|nr:hypothetical protein CWN20_23380 [Klebsiella pneumoniae]PLL41042.1 hypothetical protein CWN30_02245 [Klebsiella pneumoniae]PLM78365.1 hypothetical protein CWN12_07550 [Klebsiella pneumoniae]PLN14362.1 hypothetical protein CWN24_05490 [Klebsiella pneumoniae]PLN95050.1 hypothetical protein CWN64_04505 [Klebsiella pneumoniae]